MEKKVKIIAECVCDLPQATLEQYDIETVFFEITTEYGTFTDRREMSARNVFEHIENGGRTATSSAPAAEVYREVFERNLAQYEEIILVAISSKVSDSCANAALAVADMKDAGPRVHIFDSGHLSTGLGFLVIRAGELAEAGASAETILAELAEMRPRVSTSFIAMGTEYLYRNGKVSRQVRDICSLLSVHPVLAMEEGRMVLRGVEFGEYEKCCRRYIRKTLKKASQIDRTAGFLTHAECSWKLVRDFQAEVMALCSFETLTVTKASATVSSNCGPNSMGILFLKKA